MVTSVGWNPFFDNKSKTVEPHLLHEFPSDFYGAEIRIVFTGRNPTAANMRESAQGLRNFRDKMHGNCDRRTRVL